jgi:cell division protein FtsB
VPRRTTVLLLCLGLTTYFAYHAINGQHGLEARSRLRERSTTIERDISALEAVRTNLAREVAGLSQTHPDPDLIDEMARRMFAVSMPDERIILTGTPAR